LKILIEFGFDDIEMSIYLKAVNLF